MGAIEVQHPKVVVIGAGSLFFGRQAVWQMVHSPHLNTGTLALVDADPKRLDRMARLAEMVIADNGVSLALGGIHHVEGCAAGCGLRCPELRESVGHVSRHRLRRVGTVRGPDVFGRYHWPRRDLPCDA